MSCETECLAVAVPGPPGAPGLDGAAGVNGVSAFTLSGAAFTMPAEGADAVSLLVGDSQWMTPNQKVYLAGAGYLEVRSKADATHVVLRNAENTASGLYAENVASGTVVAAGALLSPAGLQGPAGTAPGGALLAASNLSDLTVVPTARANLGLGTAALRAVGVANTALPPVDDAAFTNGEMVRATAAGVESVSAATARTALALGTIATQAASAVAVTGGSVTGLTALTVAGPAAVIDLTASGETKLNGKVFNSPSALQSLLATTQIVPNRGKLRVVGNGGAVVLTSIPTIAAATDDGQQLEIMGTSNVNTVTLQDNATLAGSSIKLGAATRALGANDTLTLSWDTTSSLWAEKSYVNVV